MQSVVRRRTTQFPISEHGAGVAWPIARLQDGMTDPVFRPFLAREVPQDGRSSLQSTHAEIADDFGPWLGEARAGAD